MLAVGVGARDSIPRKDALGQACEGARALAHLFLQIKDVFPVGSRKAKAARSSEASWLCCASSSPSCMRGKKAAKACTTPTTAATAWCRRGEGEGKGKWNKRTSAENNNVVFFGNLVHGDGSIWV